jgi:hypothetical protein
MDYRFTFKQGCGSKSCLGELAPRIVHEAQLLEAIWKSNDFHQFCFDNDLDICSLGKAEIIAEYAQFIGELRGGFCTIELL